MLSPYGYGVWPKRLVTADDLTPLRALSVHGRGLHGETGLRFRKGMFVTVLELSRRSQASLVYTRRDAGRVPASLLQGGA